jgi:hypothetical protein
MPTKHESTTLLLDPRSVQTGVCILDGVVLCGLFLTAKYEPEIPEYIEVCGIRKPIQKLSPERIGGTLIVWRSANGTTILCPKRNAMHVSGRRLRRLEREHRGIEFKFLPVSVVDPFAFKTFGKGWLELTRAQRWEVSAAIAESLRYKAVDQDLPQFLHTTAPLLPSPKPPRVPVTVIPAPKPQPKPDGLGMQWARVVGFILGVLALIVLPFALLRGLEVAFGGAVAAITAYAVLAACAWTNKHKRVVGGSDVAF